MKTKTRTIPKNFRIPDVEKIKLIVADEFGVTVADIDGWNKEVPLPSIRHVAMNFSRELVPTCAASLPKTARAFGRSNQMTILHAVRATEARCENNSGFGLKVHALRLRIKEALEAPRRAP